MLNKLLIQPKNEGMCLNMASIVEQAGGKSVIRLLFQTQLLTFFDHISQGFTVLIRDYTI